MLRVTFPTYLICIYFSTLTHACCIPNPSCGPWLYHPNNIWRGKIMNGKTMDNSITKAMGTELGDQGFISSCDRTCFFPLPRTTWGWFRSPCRHPLSPWALFVWVKQTECKASHATSSSESFYLHFLSRLGRRNGVHKYCILYMFVTISLFFKLWWKGFFLSLSLIPGK